MNIGEEYERLKAFLSTEEGWARFDDMWMIALNYEKVGDNWKKRSDSLGDDTSGFAIDYSTNLYHMSIRGRDHSRAVFSLERRLMELKFDDFDNRKIIKGVAAYMAEWAYPVLQLECIQLTDEELELLESKILELGVGLPISRLFEARNKKLQSTRT